MIVTKVAMTVYVLFWLHFLYAISAEETKETTDVVADYCQFESFQPRCQKNEVILIKSATYGRMRIGRCITADEVAEQKLLAGGDDPRILGCSENVLPILDKKCSAKRECETRVYDISAENAKLCLSGLKMYLEVSYRCINIADEERSCTVVASLNPTHIIGSSNSQRICGTPSQPWIVEAPVGQKVSLTLIDFSSSDKTQGQQLHQCRHFGVIVDKASKRNTSICGDGMQREKAIFMSSGNTVNIFINPPDQREGNGDGRSFILKLEVTGCSDIIPPEDAWLKRNDDSIVIGCYSSRQTWQLGCKEGKWVGVLGNCSQGRDSVPSDSSLSSNTEKSESSLELGLAVAAIVGFTLAICIVIIGIGAICLRRYKSRQKQEYKTLNYSSARALPTQQQIRAHFETSSDGNDAKVFDFQQVPTYSVYVGETGSTGFRNPVE